MSSVIRIRTGALHGVLTTDIPNLPRLNNTHLLDIVHEHTLHHLRRQSKQIENVERGIDARQIDLDEVRRHVAQFRHLRGCIGDIGRRVERDEGRNPEIIHDVYWCWLLCCACRRVDQGRRREKNRELFKLKANQWRHRAQILVQKDMGSARIYMLFFHAVPWLSSVKEKRAGLISLPQRAYLSNVCDLE
jgi:hypothetical protein